MERAIMNIDYSNKLATGYTKLPNKLLIVILSGKISRSETAIVLLILRLTVSFQRRQVNLSKRAIAKITGLQCSTVLKSIENLISLNIIEKEAGDNKSSNKYAISEYIDLPGKEEKDENKANADLTNNKNKRKIINIKEGRPKSKPPEDKNKIKAKSIASGWADSTPRGWVDSAPQGGSIPHPRVGQFHTPGWVDFTPHIKDNIRKINNKNTLSLTPRVFRKYFEDLKPKLKKEREFNFYKKLKEDYSEQEIVDCFVYLEKHGIPNSRDPCHSPMAFLASSMDTVLKIVNKHENRERMEKNKMAKVLEFRKVEEDKNKDRKLKIKKAREAFEKKVPIDQQENLIESIANKKFGKIRPPGNILRDLVIWEWHVEQ
ncbi:MAG: replication protein [Pseudomonadota bacterium]